jgi:hypothetical protein
MDQINKLKHQLYEIELRIIGMESLQTKSGLKKNEATALGILRDKREKLMVQLKNLR